MTSEDSEDNNDAESEIQVSPEVQQSAARRSQNNKTTSQVVAGNVSIADKEPSSYEEAISSSYCENWRERQ